MTNRVGVGGCRSGCGPADTSQDIVPVRPVLERLSPTPAQAAAIMQANGTYYDWVTDVPIQGPTDPGIRAADCWWKKNVIDRAVTDDQGAMVPRWTQHSLCVGERPCAGVAGVGESIRRGGMRLGALGQDPPAAAPAGAPTAAAPASPPPAASAPPPPPGIWSRLSDAESHWIASTLIQLNTLIIRAGSKPCVTWPADLLKDDASAIAKLPAAVGCFQSWFNANMKPPTALRTDGALDEKTVCALVATTGLHAADFPTPYPGVLQCGGLSMMAKIGIGVAAVAVVGGAVAAVAVASGKKHPAHSAVSEARQPKLIDPMRNGFQIRQHSSGVYQVYRGRFAANSTPVYTSHDLSRARDYVNRHGG